MAILSSRTGRRLVHRITFALLAILVLRTWFIEGLIVPFQITGGSMATTLLPAHCDVRCEDCQFPFVRDVPHSSTDSATVCPHCGFVQNSPGPLSRIPGDRVLVDKSAFELRDPRRWEVVALRIPHRASDVSVKRMQSFLSVMPNALPIFGNS